MTLGRDSEPDVDGRRAPGLRGAGRVGPGLAGSAGGGAAVHLWYRLTALGPASTLLLPLITADPRGLICFLIFYEFGGW